MSEPTVSLRISGVVTESHKDEYGFTIIDKIMPGEICVGRDGDGEAKGHTLHGFTQEMQIGLAQSLVDALGICGPDADAKFIAFRAKYDGGIPVN